MNEDIIKNLKENYASTVTLFMQKLKENNDVIFNNVELLYASLYIMVENDDGVSFSILLNGEVADVLTKFENQLKNDANLRDYFVGKYCFGKLTPWGNAIKYKKTSAISALSTHFIYWYCSLDEFMDEWILALQEDNFSDEDIVFFLDNLGDIDIDVLVKLFSENRDNLVEKIVGLLSQPVRQELLNDISDHLKMSDMYACIEEMDEFRYQEILGYVKNILLVEGNSTAWSFQERILEINTNESNTEINIITDKYSFTAEIDQERDCCEIFGGYIVCEDDITSYIGSTLTKISVCDLSLNTEIVEAINSLQNAYNSCDYHNIQFINFETNKGVLQFTVYNCHNGWYGHDVTIKRDENVIYHKKI